MPTPEEIKAAEELQEAVLSVRYIGYIQARQKIIALILFEEKATTVEEGDMLGELGRVIKVTSGELEIQGPDGKSQRFALEGERK
jgi:Tfp pilus assembly protein PilP